MNLNPQKAKLKSVGLPLPYWFLGGFLLWACVLGLLLLFNDKGAPELWINKRWSSTGDQFFFYLTYLGDGLLAFPFLVFWFIFKSKREALLSTFSLLLASIFVQLSKRLLLASSPRPAAFLEHVPDLHFVEGLDIHRMNSFPSGHSMQIFVMVFIMAFAYPRIHIQVSMLLLAILVAFSRVYLMQHFLLDTLGGAALGIVCSIAVLWFLRQTSFMLSPKWQDPWLSLK
jgi:membrane-associated phospholipid phosphatase